MTVALELSAPSRAGDDVYLSQLSAGGRLLLTSSGYDQTVELATAISGPVVYGPLIAQDNVIPPAWAVKLYRSATINTPVATLTDAKAPKFRDVLNDTGTGSVVLQNTDIHLTGLLSDDVLRFELYGFAVMAIIAAQRETVAISPKEEVAEETTLSGPGTVARLAEALVYPSRGVDSLPIQEDRIFNWAAVEFDDSLWTTPKIVMRTNQTPEERPENEGWWQIGWPDKGGTDYSNWIWAPGSTPALAPEGTCYFRRTFTVAATCTARILISVDNGGDLYVDGVLLVERLSDFRRPSSVDLQLSAGDHLIAVRGTNDPFPAGGTINPAGVVYSVYVLEPNGDLGDAIMRSDDAGVGLYYPDRPPGMTPGEVIRHVIEQAQTRGVLTGVTLMFDDEVDSDGSAWPEVADIGTKVGTDLLTFLKELAGGGYIDFWMSPGAWELYAWVKGGRGSDRGVSLHAPTDPTDPLSGNLVALTYKTVE